MSENILESIPTSVSNKSHRPLKKRALTPSSQQSAQVEALFANPDRAGAGIAIGPRAKATVAPPEIVANVQGSSAGAGSGEFHVYKASRRREYERLRLMDEEVKAEEAEKEFLARKQEQEKKDEEKLSKNRARREKAKKRQEKKRQGDLESMDVDAARTELEAEGNKNATSNVVKKKLGPAKVSLSQTESRGPTQEDNMGQPVPEEAGITIHDDD